MKLKIFIIISFFFVCAKSQAQADTSLADKSFYATNFINTVNNKLSKFTNKISRRTDKTLQKFHKAELKLHKKIFARDSSMAKAQLTETLRKYDELKNSPQKVVTVLEGEYNSYIDSVKTFLGLVTANRRNFPDVSNSQIDKAKNYLAQAETKLKYSDDVKKYLSSQKEMLRNTVTQLKIFKNFKQLEKTAYYYNEYVKEYSSTLKDKKKIEKKLMALLMNNNKVKDFFAKNSMLASLFNMPGDGAVDMSNIPVLAGIQTRANVQSAMQTAASAGGPNAITQVKQQLQAGQAELNKLKDKVSSYGYSSTDAEIPSFKPNTQKTKKFLKRIEYDANIQWGKSNYYIPSTGDIGLTIGYRLNDKSSAGFGAAYKIGLGTGWNNIKLSNEGLGLRTYVDWKFKKQFYLSGGYEQNYFTQFKNIGQLKNKSAWQSSGLIGVSKKIASPKGKGTKIQILYDFLYRNHNPVSQPFIFRTGFTFK
jgi:hypothetical protein